MKRAIAVLLAAILVMTALSACTKTTSESASSEVQSEAVISSEPESSEAPAPTGRVAGAKDPATGKYINPFTGEFDIEESVNGNRPYAIMINNIKEALPQWGITAPDMYYEFLVEGGITRILGIFSDPANIPKIGPIRSARTYYVSTAKGYDSIFIHYGGSETGKELIQTLGIDDVDGMKMGSAFKRDAERLKKRAIEHTCYTDSKLIAEAVDKKQFRTKLNGSSYTAFSFLQDGEDISVNGESKKGEKITVKFSSYATSKFTYKAEDKLYYKSQFGKPQMDANTNKQVAVKNVIVIKDRHTLEEDNKKCLIIDQKQGSGYYFSDGKAVEIKWTKGGSDSPYSYTLADGSPLKVNPGKTWVAVVRNTADDNIQFS